MSAGNHTSYLRNGLTAAIIAIRELFNIADETRLRSPDITNSSDPTWNFPSGSNHNSSNDNSNDDHNVLSQPTILSP
ncbi:hypothetical protein L6452_02045 [Arctium lappa]|uniref:Uncharacterized protein n=1 Tax=Arctium lappa TaxID=4217 RepID=A0ACB9FIB1_ARCLA|nr:hypothetical protein L6452_02045 [Arctium lappa]